MKTWSAKYKTWEGAHKRAAFENGLARGEYARGEKRRIYRYHVVEKDGCYRVQRDNGTVDAEWEAKLASYSARYPVAERFAAFRAALEE
jgi:hypothetical protein